jgi:antirestriction protein ArdC
MPMIDAVRVPKAEQFKSKHNGTGGNYYASTCFHEFIHSTGAEQRLNRVGITDFIAFEKHKENYANEELIAEMGACMLMAYHNLDTSETIENSQAYIKGWLSRLSDDKSLIPVAIRQSNSAVRHILSI